MAPRTLPRLRRRGHALGARRDRQGAGRHPRAGHAGRDRAKVHQAVEDALARHGRRGARRVAPPRARRPRRRDASSASDRRNEAFAAWRRFLEALAEQRPLVLVVEDIHWADESLLDFLDELVDWVTDVPLLVVATARPELLERRPGWGGGKLNATTLALSPLSDEQTAALIGQPARAARCSPPTPSRRCSSEPAATRSTRSSSSSSTRSRARPTELALPGDAPGHHRGAPRRACPDRRRACCRTQPSSARSSGRVRSDAARMPRPRSTRSSARVSCAASAAPRSKARASSRSRTRSFATSPYGQIPRADARRSTALSRSGSRASAVPRTTPRCSPTTGARRSSSSVRPVAATTRSWSALACALRAAGDRAFALNSYAVAAAHYDDALALWPEDAERPACSSGCAVALHLSCDVARQQDALEAARDALLAVGDTERASEAESFLARVFWERGQHDAAVRSISRARRALAGDSISARGGKCSAFAARIREIAGERDEEASPRGGRVREATELGLDELRAHALTTIGMAKNDVDLGSGVAGHGACARDRSRGRLPESPRRSSTTSPSTRPCGRLSAHGRALRRGDSASASATETPRASASSAATASFSTSFSVAGTARSSRRTRSSPSARRGHRTRSSTWRREIRSGTLARPRDQDAALARPAPVVRASRRRGTSDSTGSARSQLPRRSTPSSVRSTKLTHLLCRCRQSFARVGLHGALTRLGPFADELGIGDELRDAVAAGAGPSFRFGGA